MASSGSMDDKVLIKFAQKLAGNEKKYRDKALKKLKKWLQSRTNSPKVVFAQYIEAMCYVKNEDVVGAAPTGAFTEEDFLKLWKGLHYCMWMADKPLIQEELASSLSQLLHVFSDFDQSLLFFDAFLQTEAREWNGIDKLRLDKFMMLIRRSLSQSFQCVSRHGWQMAHVEQLCAVLSSGVVSPQEGAFPQGLKAHIADVFMEELEKAHSEQLTTEHVHKFLDIYAAFLYKVKSKQLCRHVIKQVFFYVIDAAVQKMEAEAAQEEDEEDEEEEESAAFQIDYESIADSLFEYASREDCVSKNRKDIYSLVKSLQNLTEGILPAEDTISSDEEAEDIDKALIRLQRFEKSMSTNTKQGQLAKKKKQKRKAAQMESPDDQPPKKKKKKGTDDEEEADLLVKPKKTKNKFKKDKRSKKLALAKSPVFSENPKDDGDDNMEADISGDPFEDSNSTAALVVENGEPASVGAKKKKKKKKNKNLASGDSDVNGVPDSKSDYESSQNDSQMDMDSSDIAGDTPPPTKSGKKGKAKSLDSPSEPNKLSKKEKKKRRTLDNSDLVNTKKIENIELDFVQIKDKKKGKSKSHSVDEAMENGGEIEIFIPNKKYKGALKEQFEEKAKEALESEKFASFKKSKTPPAFVKKAFLKANAGSMTDPQKKRKKRLSLDKIPGSEPSKKRVSFIMANNTAQEFRDSLKLSPVVPFNPLILPETGILKTSPSPQPTPKKQLSFKKRAKAADFF